MPVPASLLRFLDSQLSEAAGSDADRAVLRGVLARSFAVGLGALLAFPLWVAHGAPGSVFAALTFFWALAPLAPIARLARLGNVLKAHVVAAAASAGLVAWLAMMTGGLSSPILPWLLLVPLAALPSGGRNVLVGNAVIALLALGAVAVIGTVTPSFIPAWPLPGFATVVSLGALFVAGAALLAPIVARPTADNSGRRAEDQIYRMLTEHSIDLVTRHGSGAAVEFASGATNELLGLRPADLAGDGLFRLVNVADRPKYLSAITDVLRGAREATIEYRLRRRGADGRSETTIWVETRCRPVPGPNGKPVAAVAVTRDISERKAAEAEGEEARFAAESANVAKSRFLAHMSHELRTPLNSIVGFSEILTSDKLISYDKARWHEYARLIQHSGEHLLTVVNNLLDVSKIEAGMFTIAPEPVALQGIVEECGALMLPQATQRSLTVTSRVDPDLPDVLADRHACHQILLNLLSNAVKFSRVGGAILVTAHRVGESVALSVEDGGIGVAENDLPRLGIPFFQADSAYNRKYEGTGLGLSIVKGLVSLHGGEVTIRSKAGLGTTVTVTLPLAAGTSAERDNGIAGLLIRERKIA